MINILKKIKNDKNYRVKVEQELKNRLLFFNISNKNVRNLASREYYFKKFKKKYKRYLVHNEYETKKYVFSNKIWIIWLQGIESAPKLVIKCMESIKKNFVNKEIVIIDIENYKNWVDIPNFVIEKFKKGYIPYAHFCDILRTELLIKYGGLYLDATVFMTGLPDFKLNDNVPLFVYKSISLYRKEKLSVVASNWLIYSCKNNNILTLTRDLLYLYWKKYNKVVIYSIYHLFFSLATEVYEDEWNKIPAYSNIPPHILQFELLNKFDEKRFKEIKSMSCFHKLNRRIQCDDSDSFYSYILKH